MKFENQLQKRLVIKTFLLSTALILLFGLIGLFIQYAVLKDDQKQLIQAIEKTHVSLISNQLYNFDYISTDQIVAALNNLEFIGGLSVESADGQYKKSIGLIDVNDLNFKYQLTFDGYFGEEYLGELTISPNPLWIFKQLNIAGVSFILPMFLLAFTVSIVCLLLVRSMILRHLNSIVEQSQENQGENIHPFKLIGYRYKDDELDSVISSLNKMVNTVMVNSAAKEQALESLRLHGEQLENTIKNRTQQLYDAKKNVEESSQAKSNFIANMSHEIRTPMNGINGLLQLCMRTSLNDKQKDYLEKIQRSSNSLMLVINDILDFSNIEKGNIELKQQIFSLNDLLTESCQLFINNCRIKKVNLFLETMYVGDVNVEGDKVRVAQILNNLLNNAIKFTESGHISIKVELVSDRVIFNVIDTGIGIEKDQLQKIFSAFSQVDNSNTREYGGAGLGLKIASDLVKVLGGSIDAVSQLGIGSRFQVTLPLHPNIQNEVSLNPVANKSLIVIGPANELRSHVLKLAEISNVPVVTMEHFDPIVKDDGFAVLFLEDVDPKCDLPILVIEANDVNHYELLELPITSEQFINRLNVTIEDQEPGSLIDTEFPEYDHQRVLLVEDNEINAMIVLSLLEQSNLVVDLAVNGKEAIEFLNKNTYALTLMDIQMPVMDGFEAIDIIRHDAQLKDQIVIALTALTSDLEVNRCNESGFNGHLGKPIDLEKMYETLNYWLIHKK